MYIPPPAGPSIYLSRIGEKRENPCEHTRVLVFHPLARPRLLTTLFLLPFSLVVH